MTKTVSAAVLSLLLLIGLVLPASLPIAFAAALIFVARAYLTRKRLSQAAG